LISANTGKFVAAPPEPINAHSGSASEDIKARVAREGARTIPVCSDSILTLPSPFISSETSGEKRRKDRGEAGKEGARKEEKKKGGMKE
jgi:hypothetical protein